MSDPTRAEIVALNLDDKLNLESERRRSRRFRIENLSELVLDVNGRTITCVIHDISETGALLETSTGNLPNCFVLNAPDQSLRVLCRKVRTWNNLTGVEFLRNGS